MTPKLTKESIHQKIDFAFKVYKKYSALKFKKVELNKPCDFRIRFCEQDHGDGFPFHRAGCVLAHGFYPSQGTAGDLQLDADENWIDQETSPGHNLFVIAVHKIGH